jgi:N-acetylglucosamine malate deacetylase 1
VSIDLLAVGAHPDDVELGVGGLIHKSATRGLGVAILDLTRGELATRGSVEERQAEAEEAARRLGVMKRVNAGLSDGCVANTDEQRQAVIQAIRLFRPKVILAPMRQDRHPDHDAAHGLVRDANFLAGLARIETDAPPHRAAHIYYYHPYDEDPGPAGLVIDISEHFEAKLDALRAYGSQFHNPTYEGRDTFVASAAFWDLIQVRAAYWGRRIGVDYGEPLYTAEPIGLDLPPGLGGASS